MAETDLATEAGMEFRFGDYALDVDRRELRCGSDAVAVEPQVFDLLEFLIRQRDRVVTKDDLIDSVWGGRIVSDSTLTSRINAARKAVGDSGEAQRLIRTIPRKGIRFVAEVRETRPPAVAEATAAATAPPQDITFCRTRDGINLAIGAVGKGTSLVRAGSWLTHLEYDWASPIWAPMLHRLAGFCRLVRYDARGNGLSDRAIGSITFEDFVCDLETVVDAAGVERAAFLGASQGAAVAIAYAVRHPERVSKLVLVGGYAQGRNKRASPADAEMAQAFVSIMRLGWGDEHSAFMRAFSSVYLPNGTQEQIKAFVDLQRITTSADNAVKLRTACDDIDVVALLPQVRVPTLVLHSRNDSVAPYEQGRLVAASIPGARFVTLESDNHVVLSGEPAWAKLMKEIETFLGE